VESCGSDGFSFTMLPSRAKTICIGFNLPPADFLSICRFLCTVNNAVTTHVICNTFHSCHSENWCASYTHETYNENRRCDCKIPYNAPCLNHRVQCSSSCKFLCYYFSRLVMFWICSAFVLYKALYCGV